ncbi:aminotransferase class I/II-fold pyridoxal phosphate-dependent enzyme [Guptibacillus hwajinpoensis]|uniref:aminotransferase class I/II-fold pyridoxal phosphate-dependent enzyme n=1 Tax=Guptibacillus hwajinpoensis TaxID=208199 RepID=UPI00272DDE9A|nr:aminotransferase class I/II-fold pyridoxal phosphate-dependent enzyme [Pseudalkalibacillus hwajinpoensis]
MSGNEQKYIQEAFDSNWIAPLGANVDAFEKEIATYVGASDAIAVSSGTAAIHLALSLLSVSRGDQVFCSTLTFVASANPILYLGAEPVFIDSEPETWNMSPEALERALVDAAREQRLPKAVIVVHLYGQSAKMDEILNLCNRYEVPVIEDSAESLGSTYKGKASGTLGKFGVYSFNGNKIITTSGGGMLVSNDRHAIQQARFLATQARDQAHHYQHSQLGYNYRMSNILAGIGRAQLEVLNERIASRRKVFDTYLREFSILQEVEFMPELLNTMSNRWLTALTINEKAISTTNEILEDMRNHNIEGRPVWKPLHLQPLYRSAKYYPHKEKNHVAERLFRSGICLPSGSNLLEDDQMYIIDSFKKALRMKEPVREMV